MRQPQQQDHAPWADGDGKGKIELQEDELSKVRNKLQGGKLGKGKSMGECVAGGREEQEQDWRRDPSNRSMQPVAESDVYRS